MIENRVLAARHGAPRMRHLQIPCLPLATEAAMELRLIEQACGCSTVRWRRRRMQTRKVRARLCRWHSGGECLPPGPRTCTCRCFAFATESRHGAPTDRASFVAAPRCATRSSLKVRARLCSWHSGGECLLPGPRTYTCKVVCLCNGACGCFKVRGAGGGRKVHALLCRWHPGEECLPPGPRTCTCSCFAFVTESRLIKQACGCSTVRGAWPEAASRCVLVSAAGTPVESACC